MPREDELVVLTLNTSTTYFEDRAGRMAGLEHDLAVGFAAYLGLAPRFVVLPSVAEVLAAVEAGAGDLAAAGLTRTPARAERFLMGPPYQAVEELTVCHPDAGVAEPADLVGKRLRVVEGSSYEESLAELRRELPALAWTARPGESAEQLLQAVWDRTVDCTVVDSHVLAINQRFMPDLEVVFSLGDEEELVWLVADHAAHLLEPLGEWLEELEADGRLQERLDYYYGYVEDFDRYDTAVFRRRVASRLPIYAPLFTEAEGVSGLPWELLAAVSYQESHWQPDAVSRTGVRGMMMLTRATAASLGVDDRRDPEQSVLAGARYLGELIERLPGYIPSPDRVWLGLAAYNVGYSHLRDARVLAVELDRDPNSWPGVKSVLPYLSRPRYYQRLRHGYARGHEPVIFVERVRNYYDLLVRQLEEEGEPVLPAEVAELAREVERTAAGVAPQGGTAAAAGPSGEQAESGEAPEVAVGGQGDGGSPG